MFLLAFLLTVLFFLVVGAAVFVVFLLLPWQRRYALSAALWCAIWGPCLVALEMLAGLSLAAEGLALKGWGSRDFQLPPLPLWGAYAVVGLIGTLLAATVAAWLHQMLINRMTLALFRVYATGVVAGIGSTLGLAWSVWLATLEGFPYRWAAALVGIGLLGAGFGYGGLRWAHLLRGPRPERMQWISPAEFEGKV